jgi:hypothetical protein
MATDPAIQMQPSEAVDWETRYLTMKVIAEKRLVEIDRQDGEIADLRRQLAALRARAK